MKGGEELKNRKIFFMIMFTAFNILFIDYKLNATVDEEVVQNLEQTLKKRKDNFSKNFKTDMRKKIDLKTFEEYIKKEKNVISETNSSKLKRRYSRTKNSNDGVVEEVNYENGKIEFYKTGEIAVTLLYSEDITPITIDQQNNIKSAAANKVIFASSKRYFYNGFNQKIIEFYIHGKWNCNGKSSRYIGKTGKNYTKSLMFGFAAFTKNVNMYILKDNTQGWRQYGEAGSLWSRIDYDHRLAVSSKTCKPSSFLR